MLTGRVDWTIEPSELSVTLEEKRAEGRALWDLTVSNPTRSELAYPEEEILDALAPGASALDYTPEPKGLLGAREAVTRYYASRGARVDPSDVVLTASTSEAYAFLFKLLCRPGDDVLVPRPSYPLFDFLATLEAVRPLAYPLFFHDGWRIDFGALEAALTPRTRAILAVHPNNPTGTYVASSDRARLIELATERELALVVDEVFLDFPLGLDAAPESFATGAEGLVFVLSGLSKLAGLPQLKLSWIAARGERQRRAEALEGLEHIADQYLSVATPVQLALSRLLEIAPRVRDAIAERLRDDLARMSAACASEPAVTLLPPEGGWYATLRLPAIQSSEAWALALLEKASVYVHPGELFGFHRDAYVVLSLLTPPLAFERGLREALRVVSDTMIAGDG